MSLSGTRYKLDEFRETNVAYEFHPMRVPRMPTLFSYGQRRDETPTNTTIDERTLRPDTEKEVLRRKSGYEVRLYLETNFRKACQGNPELRQFPQSLDVTDRLDP